MPSSRIGIGRHTVRWRAALTLGIGLVIGPGAAVAARIIEVRVGEHAEFTRVVFQLDTRATYNVEPIAAGSREILVTLAAEGTLRSLPSKSPLLSGVRISPGPGGTVAHLDLRSPDVHVTEMVLKGPDRVVLDLRSTKAGAKAVARTTPAPTKLAKAEPVEAKGREAAKPSAPAPVAVPPAAPPAAKAKSEPPGLKLVQTADKLEALAPGTPKPGEGAPAPAAPPGLSEPSKRETGTPPAPVASGEVSPPAAPIETAGEGAATVAVPPPDAGEWPAPIVEPGVPEAGGAPPPATPFPEPTQEPGAPPSAAKPERPPAATRPVPEAPRRAVAPAPPASTPPSLTERLGNPYVLAGLVGLVLVLLLLWRSLRRRASEGARALPFPPEEVEESIEFEAPAAEDVSREVQEPEPAPPAEAPSHADSLFEAPEEPEPKGAIAMEPATPLAPPVPPGAVTLPGVDLGTVIHELEQRIESLEAHLKELLDARERLERQVNAQTEELRVQRAAIARTQRVVRTLARPDDAGAETVTNPD